MQLVSHAPRRGYYYVLLVEQPPRPRWEGERSGNGTVRPHDLRACFTVWYPSEYNMSIQVGIHEGKVET